VRMMHTVHIVTHQWACMEKAVNHVMRGVAT
jgi:hypothetical protein